MKTTQHSNTRCPVYLHPAACTSPAAIKLIQQRTGLLVIVNTRLSTSTPRLAPVVSNDLMPWGGDAA